MNYLIIRIQRAEDETVPEAKRPPPILTLHKRCSRTRGYLNWDLIQRLLDPHGYELGMLVGLRTPKNEWPLTAITYESPNKDGIGRWNSQVTRWPVRKR